MPNAPLTKPSGETQQVDVAANLAAVKGSVSAAASEAGRDPGAVTLIAVSKGHDVSRIVPALAAGHTEFGENRVQEAEAKWPALKAEYPNRTLHLIGALQTNKVRDAVAIADVIHTLDRNKLAKALAREMERQNRRPACFVQVNTGAEPQKAGVLPEALDALVAECRDDLALPLAGLMCIPPIDEEPALHFALLRKLAERNGLDGLSMGMSADYETAIAFGATHVRVGTVIFGTRPPRPA
jgi:pyridoxal phosphate enzyme (YggS family)